MPSTRSTPKTTGKARGAPKKQASHKAKLAAVEEDESGDEAVDKPTASGQGLVAVATVESIERSIAEQQQELMRLRARAVLESRMAVLAEEIDALNAKKGAAPGLELVTKPLPTDKKSRKRAREESSSEESSDSSSSDEMDLGSGRSSSSDSEDRPRKKKKTGKKGKKAISKTHLTSLAPASQNPGREWASRDEGFVENPSRSAESHISRRLDGPGVRATAALLETHRRAGGGGTFSH
jgi:hypothetical protein